MHRRVLVKNSAFSLVTMGLSPSFLSIPSGLAFAYPATDAVSRSAAAKVADTLHVKDFGAVGDGTTDDTVAIQAALDSGYNVEFGDASNTYRTTAPLRIVTDGQRVTSHGSVIATDGVELSALYIGWTGTGFVKTDNVTIDGLILVGQADGTPDSIPCGIAILGPTTNPYVEGGGCSRLTIRNVRERGFGFGVSATAVDQLMVEHCLFGQNIRWTAGGGVGYGVFLQACWKVDISNNDFVAGTKDRHAIYLSCDPARSGGQSTVKQVTITNNRFDWTAVIGSTGATGYEQICAMRGPEDVAITGNVFVGGYGALAFTADYGLSKNIAITGNIFRGQVAKVGVEFAIIYFSRTSGWSESCSRVTISGNTVDATTAPDNLHGFLFVAVDQLTITDNVMSTSGYSCLSFLGDVTNVVIACNSMTATTHYICFFALTGNGKFYFGRNHLYLTGGIALWLFSTTPTRLVFGYPLVCAVEANATGAPVIRADPDGIVSSVAVDANGIAITFVAGLVSGVDFLAGVTTNACTVSTRAYNRSFVNPLVVGMQDNTGTVLPAATSNYVVAVSLAGSPS